MIAPFTKRWIRTVTVLTGIVVLTLALVLLAYPSLRGYLSPMLSIVTASYLAYMGAYVGYDWGVESLEPKLRIARRQK